MSANTSLTRCISAIVKQHGSLRAAARAHRVDAGYLSRLQSGIKSDPSAETIRRLHLERVVYYRRRK